MQWWLAYLHLINPCVHSRRAVVENLLAFDPWSWTSEGQPQTVWRVASAHFTTQCHGLHCTSVRGINTVSKQVSSPTRYFRGYFCLPHGRPGSGRCLSGVSRGLDVCLIPLTLFLLCSKYLQNSYSFNNIS